LSWTISSAKTSRRKSSRALLTGSGEALQYEQFEDFDEPSFGDEDDDDMDDSDRDDDEEDSDEEVCCII